MANFIASGNPNTRPEYTDCCWPHCLRRVEGGSETPLCDGHYEYVGRLFLKGVMRVTAEHMPLAERPDRAEAMNAQSQVYYLRIGDHVKIGYTINLRQRLGALRRR